MNPRTRSRETSRGTSVSWLRAAVVLSSAVLIGVSLYANRETALPESFDEVDLAVSGLH